MNPHADTTRCSDADRDAVADELATPSNDASTSAELDAVACAGRVYRV